MASIIVTWEPDEWFTPVNRRATNDLPKQVKGTAFWLHHQSCPSGYYYTEGNQAPVPVEFINDTWYILHFSSTEQIFGSRSLYQIDPNNTNIGLGCWPDSQTQLPTQIIQVQTTDLAAPREQSPVISESGSEINQTDQWGPETAVPADDEPIAAPGPLDEALAATLDPVVSLQGSLPLDPPMQSTMSVNVTTTTPANPPSSNGGMRGVPPTIFDGMWSKADDFWGQFWRFKLVNRTHEAMKVPFDRVLTALTYMHGPLINDWIDQQEKKLAAQIDTSQRNWVREDNKVLWTKFETAFLAAWTNTSKKQNAYDQLMHLTMSGWDIDMYIATFDCLALAAGWDLDLEGTIAKFREGLSKGIHSKALDQDHIPCTINEWKQPLEQKLLEQKRSTMQDLPGINVATHQSPEHTRILRPHHVPNQTQITPVLFQWK